MGIQNFSPPIETAAGVVSSLFDHIVSFGAPLISVRTYMPLLQEANTQGMDNIRKLLNGVSYAAGSTRPELAAVSAAFAQLGGLLVVDAANRQGRERAEAVGAALTFAMMADWAQPRTPERQPLPAHDRAVQSLYVPIRLLAAEGMKRTVDCCRLAAAQSFPPRQDGHAAYQDHLLGKARRMLAVLPLPQRIG